MLFKAATALRRLELGSSAFAFDGAGVIESIGPSVQCFKAGDEIHYSGSPIRQGSNAEFQLVDSRSVALKPKSLSFAQAAAMPLTWITDWEALVERLEIQKEENAGILIINGAGGVGSVASQIARRVLNLPVVINTTRREETTQFSKDIQDLKLDVPIKYVFITHTPISGYLAPAAKIWAPFGKVCSIVQDIEMPMYGTEFTAKSLTFVRALLGTNRIMGELGRLLDQGVVRCHLRQTLRMDEEGVREAHEIIGGGKVVGKVALEL
ncbi:hypothetical protein CC80DRAFT_520309 [Byssothecium circinans]|uniref:Enoyl reductase (ER) domain-containing protein n=1 Tax=Byssothecium circinans TaxID=147558 RepID=A0A6A5TC73_9PLEO|nr:hypothetical protein CC80DRAFT_520309 [Byssothecium circinans]